MNTMNEAILQFMKQHGYSHVFGKASLTDGWVGFKKGDEYEYWDETLTKRIEKP